ncbi:MULTISPECIES: TonB-dependent receptor domain-containing protein [Campylobacter]|uniref:TonB-dependent receptor domain-containing protein n=1 Tax=Campylobacter TaxID=194 RepID=UPI00087443AA|nr:MULTISPECIES: TonB-dependent receptor [Campylobacter]EAJ8746418.1 TonB-dependent receptor [Campylobacter jejuni]EAL0242286.1 TonB-dependent receptor [Campylobacter jejuni]EAL1800812.1 TonB-dependent receptor [Campylobacter jejuni]EAL8917600.1 TonB-dependent receptor [Campylobacter jejuni]EFP2894353.1 TonB-dependent receptor [Campylobacter jejuni]
MKFKKSLLCFLILSGALLKAEEKYQLNDVVVSASGFEQDLVDAPASISIITKEELEKKPIKDIGEAIGDIPGVDVTMNKTGTYDFSIRGFGSSYTLVLIDGKRQSVANGFYDNGFSGSESGYLPPLSMIERIEVIRGPASTLYGSDAVGGVINIITKKNPDKTEANIEFNTLLQQHSNHYGNAGGFNAYVATPLIEDTLSISARLKYYDKATSDLKWPTPVWNSSQQRPDNYQIASHSPGAFTSLGFGSRLNWTVNDKNNIYFDIERYINEISVNSTSSRAIKSERQLFKDNIVLNHDGNYDFGSTNSYLQYGSTKDKELHSQIWVGEGKVVLPWNLGQYGNLVNTFGVRIDYEMLKNDQASAGSQIRGKNLDQTTVALYGENEYFITDDLIFTTGLRYIYSDLFDSEFTPRVYLVYRLNDNIAFKGGVSKGYKTPAAKELTNGYYNYSNDNAYFGNPDLKPEESINYELGVDFRIFDFAHYSITGFITDFTNQISSEDLTGLLNGINCDDNTCTRPINLGKTQTKGVEFAFNTKTYNGFSLNSSYTFMDNHYKDGQKNWFGGDRIENLPRHIAMLKLNYERGKFSSYIKTRARLDTIAKAKGGGNGSLPWQKYKPFYIVDLVINYKINKQSSLSFAVQNLFDKNFFDPQVTKWDGANPAGYANRYQDYTEGRSFWLSYKYDF